VATTYLALSRSGRHEAGIGDNTIGRATMATWQFSSKCNNLDRPDAESRTCVDREREPPL
jgi:hypothetical protein